MINGGAIKLLFIFPIASECVFAHFYAGDDDVLAVFIFLSFSRISFTHQPRCVYGMGDELSNGKMMRQGEVVSSRFYVH